MPLATSRSTHRSHNMPLIVSKGVAERSGGDHTKRVLSPSSFEVSFILHFSFMTRLLSLLLCSPLSSLCTHPNIPNPFIRSVLFVPQNQMRLPVLYKYWPLSTCMFPSLVIISLLLVILALSGKPLFLSQVRTSAPISPRSSSLQNSHRPLADYDSELA